MSFTDIINRYAVYANDSFFDGDKLKTKELENLYNTVDGEEKPFTFVYAMLNGTGSLMNNMFINRKKFTDEEIYKQCILNGKTWKEFLDYKEPDKNMLI